MRTSKTWLWLGIATLFIVPASAEAQGPTIAFTSVTEIDEGEPIPIEVAFPTSTGTVTWSWDTDFDTVFGEHPDTSMYTVPATDTDGTVTLRIGVQATDDTGTRQTYRNILVNNIEPEITSNPPLMAQVRREYRYEVAVDDPAGANDPIEYVLTSKPEGMDVAGNVVTWTPTAAQRGRDFSVILRVSDGDGGGDDQAWDIRVANNTAPTSPTPVSPIMRAQVSADEPVTLTVENATDADGDPLLYFFRLSRTATFDGSDVIGSGEVIEGADGMTSWTTSEPIEAGHWYWQVWVSDEIDETAPTYATLVVGDPTALPDAGGQLPDLPDGGLIGGIDAGTSGGGGGCSVAHGTHGGGAPASFAWLLGLGLGAILFSRRRR